MCTDVCYYKGLGFFNNEGLVIGNMFKAYHEGYKASKCSLKVILQILAARKY